MKLAGANPNPQVSGLDELPGKSNYFIGNDPAKWRTNVPNYGKYFATGTYIPVLTSFIMATKGSWSTTSWSPQGRTPT